MVKISRNVSLKDLTSWLVGGEVDYFCLPKTIDEIKECLRFSKEKSIPYFILGGGSNVLISDEKINALCICLKDFNGKLVEENNSEIKVICESGVSKSDLLKVFLKSKSAAAMMMAGIPGDVGGGVVMNAGVAENFQPREFYELVQSIKVLKEDLSIQEYYCEDLTWSYRHSEGWKPGIIVEVVLKTSKNDLPDIMEKVRQANKIRLSKQPLDKPSCGSVFRNPEGYKAAQLIDQNGLKGLTFGQAQVSTKHANFIVNLGQAKAIDIDQLIKHVQKVIKEKTQVELQTEVVRIGNFGNPKD